MQERKKGKQINAHVLWHTGCGMNIEIFLCHNSCCIKDKFTVVFHILQRWQNTEP